MMTVLKNKKEGSTPGIEPGTSSTLKTNHTPRPSGLHISSKRIKVCDTHTCLRSFLRLGGYVYLMHTRELFSPLREDKMISNIRRNSNNTFGSEGNPENPSSHPDYLHIYRHPNNTTQAQRETRNTNHEADTAIN